MDFHLSNRLCPSEQLQENEMVYRLTSQTLNDILIGELDGRYIAGKIHHLSNNNAIYNGKTRHKLYLRFLGGNVPSKIK